MAATTPGITDNPLIAEIVNDYLEQAAQILEEPIQYGGERRNNPWVETVRDHAQGWAAEIRDLKMEISNGNDAGRESKS